MSWSGIPASDGSSRNGGAALGDTVASLNRAYDPTRVKAPVKR
jgi:hypothetical protein